MKLFEHLFKALKRLIPYLKAVGVFFVIFTLGGAGAGQYYLLHRVSDMADSYAALDLKYQALKDERHEMELREMEAQYETRLSCEALKATITNGKYSHTYCKSQAK